MNPGDFDMKKWLEMFIDTAPYHHLRAFQLQRAAGFVETLRRPISKVPDDILQNEYNKGRADEAEVDIFAEMLQNYQAFSQALDEKKGAK